MQWLMPDGSLATIYLHASSGSLGVLGRGANPIEKVLIASGYLDVSQFDDFATKTGTYQKISGGTLDYFQRVKFVKDGVVNAVGLINKGFDELCSTLMTLPYSKKKKMVVSLFGTPAEISDMAPRLRELNVKGVEYNPSCPNIKHGLTSEEIVGCCKTLKAMSGLEVRVKLDPTDFQKAREIVDQLERVVSLISINSVRWDFLFPDRKSPLEKFGGGAVSGKAVQPVTWDFAQRLHEVTSIPIVCPSIWEPADVDKAVSLGASHISLGSVLLRRPFTVASILGQIKP